MIECPIETETNEIVKTIEDLPDEVLEYILSLVPSYVDLQQCALVCRRWRCSVKNVRRHLTKKLHQALTDYRISWENITVNDMAPTISKRYSHSAVRHENSLYVFGGCTSSSTTFNDLWRLDLNKRQWVRPLTMGTYPSPKAYASMVCYKDKLILFGGWSHPSPYPLHQAWRLFSELHVYNIASNRWTCKIDTSLDPPSLGGHSATVQGKYMVVFGGLQRVHNFGQYSSSNDVWCFDLENETWHLQETTLPKPQPRYGQSQISLNNNNVLILGGCGGPNMVFSDVWLLTLSDDMWVWTEIGVRNPDYAATHLWCHPACKVGDLVVVFSRNPMSKSPVVPLWNMTQIRAAPTNVWVPPREDAQLRRPTDEEVERKPIDRDHNVNGCRGSLNSRSSSKPREIEDSSEDSSQSSSFEVEEKIQRKPKSINRNPSEDVNNQFCLAAFRDAPVRRNRQKQLESLKRMEERIRGMSNEIENNPPPVNNKPVSSSTMLMFVMDISHVLSEECYIEWLPLKDRQIPGGPEETILYTLVEGKGELIMFGGIQKDINSILSQAQFSAGCTNSVSNSTYFITAQRGVI